LRDISKRSLLNCPVMNRYLVILSLFALCYSCSEPTLRKKGYAVHGIDISHYQRYVNWEVVANQGIHFVFVKASEGESHGDSLYCKNWEEIKRVGIKRGAYHFFRPSISPLLQAENFINTVELTHGDLTPVLDVEVTDGVAADALLEGIQKWLHVVESVYKAKPIIYSNQKFFNNYLFRDFRDYPIWIARYSSWRKPHLYSGNDWLFWQYGSRGRLDGIDVNVDFNVFKGSLADLEKFCISIPESSPAAKPIGDTLANP
ncbi:MAG: glycoside hydrolase family 25 protein, partial [Saprospiraceae bacterium]